jgi:hypothetical protein
MFNNIVLKMLILLILLRYRIIRSQRGFIRTIDNNQQVIKLFPVDMGIQFIRKELKIKAEENSSL